MLHRLLLNLPVIVIVVALASGLTYLQVNPALVQGTKDTVSNEGVSQNGSKEDSGVKTEPKQEEKTEVTEPAPDEESPVKTATVRNEVNLRATMSTNSQILAVIPAGSIVTLEAEESASWQAVIYQGVRGYVAKSYLTY